MELTDYPEAIAEAARQYLAADQQVRQLQRSLEQLKQEVDQQVVFDPTLKNQNQRDCRRAEKLNANSEYQAVLTQLETARHEREMVQIALRYRRDRFSSLKLSLLAKLEFLSRVETKEDIRAHIAGLALQGLFSSYINPRSNTPGDAANQIVSFVEALLVRLEAGEPITDELWAQKVTTPEFYPEESEETESEGEP